MGRPSLAVRRLQGFTHRGVTMLRTLLNIIWLLLSGIWLAIGYGSIGPVRRRRLLRQQRLGLDVAVVGPGAVHARGLDRDDAQRALGLDVPRVARRRGRELHLIARVHLVVARVGPSALDEHVGDAARVVVEGERSVAGQVRRACVDQAQEAQERVAEPQVLTSRDRGGLAARLAGALDERARVHAVELVGVVDLSGDVARAHAAAADEVARDVDVAEEVAGVAAARVVAEDGTADAVHAAGDAVSGAGGVLAVHAAGDRRRGLALD